MKISLVIPTLNEASLLFSAVDQAWLCGADEVIVVDGGSRDDSRAIGRSLNCVWLESAPGRGTQQNAGAAVATGDILLFLHVDCRLVAGGCDQIRAVMANESVLCGAFRQKIESPKIIYRALEAGNALRVRLFSLGYGDQAIFVRRQTFTELGGFDELPLMEDFQFSQKIRRRTRYRLLQGPISVSARRWESYGPIRQTLKNWSIVAAYLSGTDPQILADRYRQRH